VTRRELISFSVEFSAWRFARLLSPSVGTLLRKPLPRTPLGLCDLAFAVDPLGFYGVEPRTLLGQLTILTPRPLFLTSRL
jgi:hypothetical protein